MIHFLQTTTTTKNNFYFAFDQFHKSYYFVYDSKTQNRRIIRLNV